MKLDDFDLLALSFFVPRMAEGPQTLHTYLKDHGWATRPPKFVRAWMELAEKKGILALIPSGTGGGMKYTLTHYGFVLYNNHLAARKRRQQQLAAA